MIQESTQQAGSGATTIKLQAGAIILIGLACKLLLDFTFLKDDGEQDLFHFAATMIVFLGMSYVLWQISRPLAQETEPETLHFPPPRRPLVIGLIAYVFFSDFMAQLMLDTLGSGTSGGNIVKFASGFILAFGIAALLTPLNARDAAHNLARQARSRHRIDEHVY